MVPAMKELATRMETLQVALTELEEACDRLVAASERYTAVASAAARWGGSSAPRWRPRRWPTVLSLFLLLGALLAASWALARGGAAVEIAQRAATSSRAACCGGLRGLVALLPTPAPYHGSKPGWHVAVENAAGAVGNALRCAALPTATEVQMLWGGSSSRRRTTSWYP